MSWKVSGHDKLVVAEYFDATRQTRVNLVHPRVAVISLSRALELPAPGPLVLASLHYASPQPEPLARIQQRARERLAQWEKKMALQTSDR